MQFKFWGISKWTGKLIGDATDLDDIYKWAASRSIDLKKPYGYRPVPSLVEQQHPHDPTYVLQSEADRFFDKK
jgi:hypothetical protein